MYLGAPGFVTRPTPANLAPGSKLSLKARLLGYPQPKVTWEKDGMKLSEDARVRLTSDQNTHVIEIESVNYTDSGLYKIVARNPLGRQHAQAIVTVSKNGSSDTMADLPANQRNKMGSWQHHSRQPLPNSPPSPDQDKSTDNYFAITRDVETASSTSSRCGFYMKLI